MRLLRLHLKDFRNIALAHLKLDGPRHFFLGLNGQGKTNLIEAVGLLGALRSFRGAEPRDLIRHGAAEARLLFVVTHECDGETEIEIVFGAQRREVSVNGKPCRALSDFLGRFPVTALSSHDLQILRGSPQLRRRAFDMALSSLDETYFNVLRRYHQALAGRNSLLRSKRELDAAELSSFETVMADEAVKVISARAKACAAIEVRLRPAYEKLSCGASETPGCVYAPDATEYSPAAWRVLWQQSRPRDIVTKTTHSGPHRDDFLFQLDDHPAKSHASEGQQRGLVVAWRLALAVWQRDITGIEPLLLADDVLGELDPERRVGFWNAASGMGQVLATGTVTPTGGQEKWIFWKTKAGTFSRGD